jgi:hypothetical protein
MATTSNTPAIRQAAVREKTPRRKYPWGAPFHVPLFAKQTTRLLCRFKLFPKARVADTNPKIDGSPYPGSVIWIQLGSEG